MHAAFRCIDIVDKAIFTVRIGIIMLQGYLNIDIILGPFKIHDLVIQGLFAPVQVSHEFPDAAFIAEGMLTDFLFFLFFSRTS